MRALIAVGCNAYQFNKPLQGAESDARRIFEALIRPEVGEYDPNRSKLLLSPRYEDLRAAIRDVLFAEKPLDTFTFFFAGHGGVKSGSFYMLLRDSRPDALSASALSLADFFLNLNEAAPTQSNIIIDACESGGLITDLGVLLKANVIGDAGTPGITLLATSAQNEFSGETSQGGFGTNALLDCIEGRDFVQDLTSALDLVEIGRRVSTKLRLTENQTPVVWGLNLYGPPRFCKNPCFGSDTTTPLREVIQVWPAAINHSIGENYHRLWTVYVSASADWNARAFANVVSPIIDRLYGTPEALVGFMERLNAAMVERALLSEDAYRPAQVGAVLATCLLRYSKEGIVTHLMGLLQQIVGEAINGASATLIESLQRDRYALLSNRGGLSDLFYLPVRIAMVLGWSGAAGLLLERGTEGRERADHLFQVLARAVLKHYPGSIVAISDAQASSWAIALSRLGELGLREEAEQLAGLLFSSLIDCGGNVAADDLSPDQVLDYLLARHSRRLDAEPDLVARPNVTTTVLLRSAEILGLEEVFDQDLWRLDGDTCTAYANEQFEQYGDERMEGGHNATWQIGGDVFRVGDLQSTWTTIGFRRPPSNMISAATVLASLVYPDRVAWFLLDRVSA